MCSLFGIIDYKDCLTDRQRTKIINTLARKSEVRGIDATGIASLHHGRLSIYKRPLPAHCLKLHPPRGSRLILGHTRMTTQGTEHSNYNNHPFLGSAGGTKFALTHNGVLTNDIRLKAQKNLSDTKIETDSYVAVQMIEQEGVLNMQSLKTMAELLEGSFTFALLDALSNFYFVKGNNPLTILHFEKGFYLYTSTDEIMIQALDKLGFCKEPFQKIKIESGDILRVDRNGAMAKETFDDTALYLSKYFYGNPYWQAQKSTISKNAANTSYQTTYIEDLKSYASTVGFDAETIDMLLEDGWSTDEIEELLYDPEGLGFYLDEMAEDHYDWSCVQ